MENNFFNLENKITIITGSSRGIGFSLAKGFIKAGAIVHGISRQKSDLLISKNYFQHTLDLQNKKSISSLIKKIGDEFGKIDVLINCAGVSIQDDNSNLIDNSINKILDINLLSPYYLSKAVIEYMKKEKNGSIINISSIGAHLGFPRNPAYISSKAGLSGLTRSMAYDYAKFGIRVNNIVPGYFKTDMTKESFNDPKKNEERASRALLSRWGEPNELIGPAIFLASNASSFMTGTDIIVDGGWSIKGL